MRTLTCLILSLLILQGCSGNKEEINFEWDQIKIGNEARLADLIEVEQAGFVNSELSDYQAVKLPKKVIQWKDYFIYQTQEKYTQDAQLYIFNTDLSLLKVLKPNTSGAPNTFKEVTDFFTWKDQLYVYDYQSQKFVIFDEDLNVASEKRSGLYLQSVISTDAGIIAYSGKKTQLIDGKEYSYDLINLTEDLSAESFAKEFDTYRSNGTAMHAGRPLINNKNEVYFTDFWNDSIYVVEGGETKVKFLFQYESPLPAEVNQKTHQEILTGLISRQFDAYEKGASPTVITDKQLLFSYGAKNTIKHGIYDLNSKKNVIFSDYIYSISEKLLMPMYAENESFISFVYPYELKDYFYSGLISEDGFDKEFLAALENEPQDGRPIMLKFKINTNDQKL